MSFCFVRIRMLLHRRHTDDGGDDGDDDDNNRLFIYFLICMGNFIHFAAACTALALLCMVLVSVSSRIGVSPVACRNRTHTVLAHC